MGISHSFIIIINLIKFMNSPISQKKEGRKERGTIQGQFNRAAAAWNMITGQECYSWVIEFQDIFP